MAKINTMYFTVVLLKKQEPVEPGDAPRIGFGHRQEISLYQQITKFWAGHDFCCKVML